jgi:hypothetical protein
MNSPLATILASASKNTEEQLHPNGSRLLLLPYGGRVLGLFAPGSDGNFFWTHPALRTAESARRLYGTRNWHNSGGDRIWLAPEIDIFFPNFPKTDIWRVPAEVDPGNYCLRRSGHALELVSSFTLTLSRSRAKVAGMITKSYTAAANPLGHEGHRGEWAEVRYAGYTQETSLELTGGSSAQIGLWSLLQLPPGGEALIPTLSKDEPKVYAGPIAPETLVVTSGLVRFLPGDGGVRKFAMRAAASTGRFGYLYPSEHDWALVVRNFTVQVSGKYLDVPWNDPTSVNDCGYSTQVCSVNNELGSYCELEYHIPAVGGDAGSDCCRDITQVWAFRGPEGRMRAAARTLLLRESKSSSPRGANHVRSLL